MDRKDNDQVIIQQVEINGNELEVIEGDNIIIQMAALCEGICMLIHCAEQTGINPSHDSLKRCIDYLEKGFADASYKAWSKKG